MPIPLVSSPSRPVWLTLVGVALSTWTAAGASAQCAGLPLAPDAVAAQIVALSGQGETRPPGTQPWLPATLAQPLGPGADMRTLALSSAALLLADRTQIRMSANAQLRLCEAQPTRTLLELAAGRLWARTKKAPANLQLQTPAALAVVRGTDWDVEVDGTGRTTLTVLSGAVELRNDQGSVQLGPAEQGVAEPGQAPVKRLLVNPRERVQWVAAYPGDLTRWAEFQSVQTAPAALAEVRTALRAEQWAQARALLQTLSAQEDGGAVVELALADLEVLDGQPDAAQQRLALAWQRTQDPRTAAGRADLLMALDRLPEARTWLDTTRAASPGFAPLLQADADWHRLQGQGDAALALYRQAVAHAEGDAQRAAAQAGLGRALQERGDLRAARSALAQAVALAPEHAAYRGEAATAAIEALRLAEARFVQQIDTSCVLDLLNDAARDKVSIMAFVGNAGMIQIHSGPVHKVAVMGPWINILDARFNLHLREDHVASAWVVKKPTVDGLVTSVELFDAKGDTIVMFFGERKPGMHELCEWRHIVDRVAQEGELCAA